MGLPAALTVTGKVRTGRRVTPARRPPSGWFGQVAMADRITPTGLGPDDRDQPRNHA